MTASPIIFNAGAMKPPIFSHLFFSEAIFRISTKVFSLQISCNCSNNGIIFVENTKHSDTTQTTLAVPFLFCLLFWGRTVTHKVRSTDISSCSWVKDFFCYDGPPGCYSNLATLWIRDRRTKLCIQKVNYLWYSISSHVS